jgi:hypothetical protein
MRVDVEESIGTIILAVAKDLILEFELFALEKRISP